MIWCCSLSRFLSIVFTWMALFMNQWSNFHTWIFQMWMKKWRCDGYLMISHFIFNVLGHLFDKHPILATDGKVYTLRAGAVEGIRSIGNGGEFSVWDSESESECWVNVVVVCINNSKHRIRRMNKIRIGMWLDWKPYSTI